MNTLVQEEHDCDINNPNNGETHKNDLMKEDFTSQMDMNDPYNDVYPPQGSILNHLFILLVLQNMLTLPILVRFMLNRSEY